MAVFDNLNKYASAGVAPGVIEYYNRAIIENVEGEYPHLRDAQSVPYPMRNGNRMKFFRFTAFDAVTEPLQEGVTPAGQSLTETEFTATIKPYAAHVEITDELDMLHLHAGHQRIAKLLGAQARLSVDSVARNALNTGMNVQYVDGANNTSRGTLIAADVLTFSEVKKAVRTLENKNAQRFPDGFYHSIVHPNVAFDLTSDSMWVDKAKYQDKEKIEKNELGCLAGVKFFRSTNAMKFTGDTYVYGTTAALTMAADTAYDADKRCLTVGTISADDARELAGKLVDAQYTSSAVAYKTPVCIERVEAGTAAKVYLRYALPSAFAASFTTTNTAKIVPTGAGASDAEVYSTLIYGQDAFGCVKLDGNGENVSIIVKPCGSSGAADPVDQRGTIAWKVKGFCTVILNDDFIVRVEGGASA